MRKNEFECKPDNLIISGQTGFQTINISIESGAFKRGTLMAFVKIDADTNVVTVAQIDPAGEESAKLPYCILVNDIDATDAPKRGVGYASGTFNSRSVILPGAMKVSDVYQACRDIGLFLNYAVPNE
uniref:Head decoration protein n=1 Tax=Serratia proteamaculans (strain 568) TaxID=399741 RepID=A8GLM1_SERP5